MTILQSTTHPWQPYSANKPYNPTELSSHYIRHRSAAHQKNYPQPAPRGRKERFAFGVAVQGTCQPPALLQQHQLASQCPPSRRTPGATRRSKLPAGFNIASPLHLEALANSVPPVPSNTHAADAGAHHMAQPTAGSEIDPRIVISPISHTKTRLLLHKLGIFHKWSHIIDGLSRGFDIGINGQPPHTIISPNHSSTKLNPDFINDYIAGEELAGRYSPPFSPSTLETLIGPFRTSPLGLVPKPGSAKLRMVQDLSFPRNDPSLLSVNSYIDASLFPTAWGSFINTAKMILALPEGCMLASFDISSAYRLTPILPSQQNWTCVAWQDKIWVDRAVMFGMSSSAGVFGAVADMLVAIYNTAGFGPISKWVDDFLVARLPNQTWTEEDFISLTAEIGVPWNRTKLRKFSKVQRYIGFDWFVDSKAVGFPPEKLDKIMAIISTWSKQGARFTSKEAAALHGKAVQITSSTPLPPTLRITSPPKFYHTTPTLATSSPTRLRETTRCELVGRCKHILWYRRCSRHPLGSMALGSRCESRATSSIRHWLGRSHSSRIRLKDGDSLEPQCTSHVPRPF
jgi:hypothetical protein